jgi:hypothetical protein
MSVSSFPVLREIIDSVHAKVHSGLAYSVSHSFTSVADTTSVDVLITVGSNKYLHSGITITATGTSSVSLYSGATVSANGTALTAYNLNRASANTTDASWYYTPTVTGTGTALAITLIPGGEKNQAVGGSAGALSRGAEWILNKSTNYLIRVTNNSGSSATINVGVMYYEAN